MRQVVQFKLSLKLLNEKIIQQVLSCGKVWKDFSKRFSYNKYRGNVQHRIVFQNIGGGLLDVAELLYVGSCIRGLLDMAELLYYVVWLPMQIIVPSYKSCK